TGPVDDLTLGFRGDGQALLDLEIEANPALYSREDVEAHAARLLHFRIGALQLTISQPCPTGPVDDLTLGFRGDGQALLDLEIEANPALYSR
ncbi:hypothetical protein C7E17_24895, partial [Stenotrophomonas maltophilia]